MDNQTPKHHTERVYDDEMAPLVAKLAEIAQRENIPLLVSAGMFCDERPSTCDTLILTGDPDVLPGIRNRLGLAYGIIRGHGGFDTAAGLMITRHHPSKS